MRFQINHGWFAAALICVAAAASAQACNLSKMVAHTSPTATAAAPNTAAEALSNAAAGADNFLPHDPTGIGLWQSTYTGSDGLTFVGFESIYADGNELLIDNSAPATDNVCSGVWELTGPRTYTVNHPSWYFDATSGDLIGIVVLKYTITVDRKGNKYTGSATVTQYDPTLTTIVYQGSGTVIGTRITTRSNPL